MRQLDPQMAQRVNKFLEQDEETLSHQEALNQIKKRKLVAESIVEALHKSIAPTGTYNLPPLLDERRKHFLIPNGAFESWPAFDKVYLWQIPVKEGDTFTEGGLIQMPDQSIAYKRNTAPRAVLLSAGLKAMDSLYSTGIQLGHIVRFKKFAPFIMPVAEINGHELAVTVVRDGDIEASEDMATQINSKQGEVKNISETGYDFRFVLNNLVSGKKVDSCYDASV